MSVRFTIYTNRVFVSSDVVEVNERRHDSPVVRGREGWWVLELEICQLIEYDLFTDYAHHSNRFRFSVYSEIRLYRKYVAVE